MCLHVHLGIDCGSWYGLRGLSTLSIAEIKTGRGRVQISLLVDTSPMGYGRAGWSILESGERRGLLGSRQISGGVRI